MVSAYELERRIADGTMSLRAEVERLALEAALRRAAGTRRRRRMPWRGRCDSVNPLKSRHLRWPMEHHLHRGWPRWWNKRSRCSKAMSAGQSSSMAQRLHGEAAVLEAAAADAKRATALSQQAEALDAERAAIERKWGEAAERWGAAEVFARAAVLRSRDGTARVVQEPLRAAGLSKMFSAS
jgi:hypothetical protein